MRSTTRLAAGLTAVGLLLTACGGDDTSVDAAADSTPTDGGVTGDPVDDDADGPLTVYSGRGEDLVGEAFDRCIEATGVEVEVRYGGTAELAATILEEGDNSPADVYWAQDAGALGALARAGALTTLSDDVLELVQPQFRSPDGQWVGITGRVRTVVYNTQILAEDDLPTSVFELTEPQWEGKVGWAPTNGSFQSFVTAMRRLHGDDTTREWVEGMLANGVREYPKNTPIVDAVGRGEIEVGLVNHYYLFRFLAEDPDFPADNLFLSDDVGGLVNVAGVGVVNGTDQPVAAEELIRCLLGEDVQSYFGAFTDELEYPLAIGVDASDELPPLSSLNPPAIDLSDLDDLEGTLTLLREAGALT